MGSVADAPGVGSEESGQRIDVDDAGCGAKLS